MSLEFFDAVVRYEVALWNATDRRLRSEGQLPLGSLYALRIVARYDGRARVQDLRADIGITVGATSKLVDRLERDGLIVRRPHPTDGRSSLVALTPTGRRAMTSGVAVAETVLTEALGGEHVDAVRDTLTRLLARLVAVGQEVAA